MKNKSALYILMLGLMSGFMYLGQNVAAEDMVDKNAVPDGYILKEVTVGDVGMEYILDENVASDAAALAEIAPAAGPASKKQFVGPRRAPETNDVWATKDTE